jgi:Tfp pilus assembly protein PilN
MNPLSRRSKATAETAVVEQPMPEAEELDLPAAPAAVVPAVNLLPSTYARRVALSRAKVFAGASVGVALLLAFLAWLVSWQQVVSAEERLAEATDQRMLLQHEQAKYSDVPAIFNAVRAAQDQIALAMGNEIRWSFFLNDLALTIPPGIALDSMQVTAVAPGATPDDPTAGIGTMSVTGKAFEYNSVANWLDSLAKLRTLSDPYIGGIVSGVEEGTPVVSYTSTAQITTEALSERYVTKEAAK